MLLVDFPQKDVICSVHSSVGNSFSLISYNFSSVVSCFFFPQCVDNVP